MTNQLWNSKLKIQDRYAAHLLSFFQEIPLQEKSSEEITSEADELLEETSGSEIDLDVEARKGGVVGSRTLVDCFVDCGKAVVC